MGTRRSLWLLPLCLLLMGQDYNVPFRPRAGGAAPTAPVLASGPTVCGTPGNADVDCTFTATAGSNRVLLVAISAESSSDVNCDAAQFTVTYGSCTLTEAAHARTDGGAIENCSRIMYCPEASIPAGSNILTVDFVSSTTLSVYYAVLTGVNQADIIDLTAVDEGDTNGEDPFTFTPGTLAAGTFQWITATLNDSPGYSTSTIAGPYTEQLDVDHVTCCSFVRYDASGTASGASQTVSIDQATAYTSRLAGALVSFNGI